MNQRIKRALLLILSTIVLVNIYIFLNDSPSNIKIEEDKTEIIQLSTEGDLDVQEDPSDDSPNDEQENASKIA